MTLIFREMIPKDLPAALAVRLLTIENPITIDELAADYGVTPECAAAAMATHVRGRLCEADGAIVGFAMGDRSTGEVTVVAVLPAHEG